MRPFMPLRRLMAMAIALSLALPAVAPATAYHGGDEAAHDFANDAFESRWARTDRPVADGQAERTWMWGPEPLTPGMVEPYLDSPGELRQVQYFDKSRMEINDPAGDPDDLWYVTNGLLVVEMVRGHYQLGDAEFDQSPAPAEEQIAGDPGNPFGPTYADIAAFGLLDVEAHEPGTVVDEYLTMTRVESSDDYRQYGVTAAHHVPETGHTVASVFWDFMNAEGTVWQDGEYVAGPLFPNPFYATGYPITEAYWTNVTVAGAPRDILWQCFERRCLTYTPANQPGWQVEAGNVGQHYLRWRYGAEGPETETMQVFLVAIGDNGARGIKFGCNDSLVPVDVEVPRHDTTEQRIVVALQELFIHEHDELYNVFTSWESQLYVQDVTIIDGQATVNLTGELIIGGVCDEPRVLRQIEYTVLQFEGIDEAVILHEGGPIFEPQVAPADGIVATFHVSGEGFRVWLTNEETIARIYALQAGESQASIPNGPIHRGSGEYQHNTPWSWHLDPEQTRMAEVTIEVCDGRPSFVEANLDYFVDEVGRYCPWGAELVEIRDYRD